MCNLNCMICITLITCFVSLVLPVLFVLLLCNFPFFAERVEPSNTLVYMFLSSKIMELHLSNLSHIIEKYLLSQIYKFWPSLTPAPCPPSSKWPSRVSFSIILAVSGEFFNRAFFQNRFPQNSLMGGFWNIGIQFYFFFCRKIEKIAVDFLFLTWVPGKCFLKNDIGLFDFFLLLKSLKARYSLNTRIIQFYLEFEVSVKIVSGGVLVLDNF